MSHDTDIVAGFSLLFRTLTKQILQLYTVPFLTNNWYRVPIRILTNNRFQLIPCSFHNKISRFGAGERQRSPLILPLSDAKLSQVVPREKSECFNQKLQNNFPTYIISCKKPTYHGLSFFVSTAHSRALVITSVNLLPPPATTPTRLRLRWKTKAVFVVPR